MDEAAGRLRVLRTRKRDPFEYLGQALGLVYTKQ